MGFNGGRIMKLFRFALATTALFSMTPAFAAITFGGSVAVAGAATDLSGISSAFGGNRLSMGSDLHYDNSTGLFYGITDRGPGGGVIDFAPRVNIFRLNVDAASANISNFQLVSTVVFKGSDGNPLSGLAPNLLPGGSSNILGRSFDSEGFVRLSNGNFLVSDEYGPSVYEFLPDGGFVRAFAPPANLLPRNSIGALDFSGTTLTNGRQDNRGYEGLTVSPDGSKAYAILQDPLVNEGDSNDGRRSRNLRIVQYDMVTGTATGQFIYQLEALADINGRIPGTANDFGATSQGRNIGVSSITALGNGKFLIIERDNRGFGVGDATGTGAPVGSKRVYIIDLAGATDVSAISLAGSNALPAGVVPVSKSLFLDVQAALLAAGLPLTEKLEGLTLVSKNGGMEFALILSTDNDFSVTQNGQGIQFDVCTSGAGGVTSQVAIGTGCPNGQFLIPSYLYSFNITGAEAGQLGAVPEPTTWGMMIAGFGIVGASLRRRSKAILA